MAKKKEERKKRVGGVICYWEYVPPKDDESKSYHKYWRLVESYQIDDDGYPITQPKNTSGGGDRHEWHKWMNTRKPLGFDPEDYDWEPVMGRAVTIWTVEGGVGLMDLHPPEWVDWLGVGFIENLRKLPNWSSFLEGGHTLYLGTARAAEKHLYGSGE